MGFMPPMSPHACVCVYIYIYIHMYTYYTYIHGVLFIPIYNVHALDVRLSKLLVRGSFQPNKCQCMYEQEYSKAKRQTNFTRVEGNSNQLTSELCKQLRAFTKLLLQ